MPFSFSFTLTVPGLTNPFSALRESSSKSPRSKVDAESTKLGSAAGPCRRSHSPSLLPPLSRKRGWIPADSEISRAAAIPTSTGGYLDTPAKYRDMVSASHQDEIEEMVADLPPPKRRRTLAGSIVSTALSAALIGTAVGLTVYRLWRHRGKQSESLPPPPYEQGEWVPPKPEPTPVPVQDTPPTPRSRKTRYVAGRRTITRHRKTLSKAAHGSISGTSVASRAPIPPEFNFRAPAGAQVDGDIDEQMSWMSDRLASLIAEGQRALGKEVVVMSEAQEDEVDDGAEGWVEEDAGQSTATSSTRTSKHRRHAGLPPYSSRLGSPNPGASPRLAAFDLNQSYRGASSAVSVPGSPRRLGREASVESDVFASFSYQEDEASWQTSDLREAMERARMRYRRERA